jgi:hypothetical protein
MTDPRWIERPGRLETPCLIWTGARSGPYGWDSGRRMNAHRAIWEETHGAIQDRAHLHHACRETMCVNVSHLRLLTAGEHRATHGLDSRRPSRLTWEAVQDIRESAETLAVVAARYSISKPYASMVRRGLAPIDHRLEQPKAAWANGRPKPPRQVGHLTDDDVAWIRDHPEISLGVMGEMFSMSRTYLSRVRRGLEPKPKE